MFDRKLIGQAMTWIGFPIAGIGQWSDVPWVFYPAILVGIAGAILWAIGHPPPKIELCAGDAFHSEDLVGFNTGFVAQMLRLRVVNRAHKYWKSTTARNVSATFQIHGPETDHLPRLDARWSHKSQPRPGDAPEQFEDLGVEAFRQIEILIKEVGAENCYLFNDGSYVRDPRRCQVPEWAIPPGAYWVEVAFHGDDGVAANFWCEFENEGAEDGIKVNDFGNSS